MDSTSPLRVTSAKYHTANTNVSYVTDGGMSPLSHKWEGKRFARGVLTKPQILYQALEGGSSDTILQLEKEDPAIDHTER